MQDFILPAFFKNVKYFKICFNVPQDCPSDAGDFRAQQCSAHADEQYQDQYHEWLPVYNDPDNPCALKCKAKGSGLVVELAPKVLDGTRCYTESLDMCISGICQVSNHVMNLNCFEVIKNFGLFLLIFEAKMYILWDLHIKTYFFQ